MNNTEEMLTANQAAKEKGVSRQAVSQAIREKRLPARLWGRFYVVRRADLDQWTPIGHRHRKPEEAGIDTRKAIR